MAKMKHLPALDGIRGAAVLLVVILHFGGGAQSGHLVLRSIGLFIQLGWSGVTLFFILSGFLITGILWDSRSVPRWWRSFYLHRTRRIFPLYFATLFVVFLTALFAHKAIFCLSRLWVYAFFLQNIPLFFSRLENVGSPLWLSHFWSLAVEEQFYLIWPFLLTRMKTIRQAQHLCTVVFLLSVLFRAAIWRFSAQPMAYNGFLFARAGELAAGGYLAMCFRDRQWERLQSMAPLLAILSLAGLIATCAMTGTFRVDNGPGMNLGLPCATALYASLLVLSLGNGVVHRFACMPWLRWFGGISYGLYVFHQLLNPVYTSLSFAIAPHLRHNSSYALKFVIGIAISILLAWLSLRYFETPFRKGKATHNPDRVHA